MCSPCDFLCQRKSKFAFPFLLLLFDGFAGYCIFICLAFTIDNDNSNNNGTSSRRDEGNECGSQQDLMGGRNESKSWAEHKFNVIVLSFQWRWPHQCATSVPCLGWLQIKLLLPLAENTRSIGKCVDYILLNVCGCGIVITTFRCKTMSIWYDDDSSSLEQKLKMKSSLIRSETQKMCHDLRQRPTYCLRCYRHFDRHRGYRCWHDGRLRYLLSTRLTLSFHHYYHLLDIAMILNLSTHLAHHRAAHDLFGVSDT